MSIVLVGSTSGSITLQEPAVAGSTVLTLPATSGTLITTGSSGQVIPKAALPTGSVLQVVSTTKTDTFSTTSTSYTDITGLSVSITPTSSSSKILVLFNLTGGNSGFSALCTFRIVRGSTAISVGNTTAGYTSATIGGARQSVDNNASWFMSAQYLDSPATTSSTTYKIQGYTEYGDLRINTTGSDTSGQNWSYRGASTITVMEIAA